MKKGDVSFQTVTLILILVSLGVLLLFSYGLGKVGEELAGREKCRDAFIIKNAKVAGQTLPFADIALNCETNLEVVNTKEAEEVMQKIADEIFWCAWQTGGNDAVSNWGSSDSINEGRYCFPCGVIEFGDEAKKIGSIDIKEDFIPYLKTHYLSGPVLNKTRVSYYTYLYGSQYPGRQREENYVPTTKIDLTKPVSVYFVLSKSDITINSPLRDFVKDGNLNYYNNGLILAANSIFKDGFKGPSLSGERDIVNSVFVFQDRINPDDLCDVDLTES